MSKKLLILLLGLIFLLMLIIIYAIVTLTTKIDNINYQLKNIKQDITCSELYFNGSTGKQYCVGLKDQLNDIQQRIK